MTPNNPPLLAATSLPASLMHCPDCQGRVSRRANSCPHCGRAIQASVGKVIWKVFFWLVVIGGASAVLQSLVKEFSR